MPQITSDRLVDALAKIPVGLKIVVSILFGDSFKPTPSLRRFQDNLSQQFPRKYDLCFFPQ